MLLRATGLLGRRVGKRFRDSSSDEDMDQSESLKIHLVQIIHKKSLRDLYVLNKDFEVVDVKGDNGLFVGDHVVEYMGMDLRGKPYEAYRNEKMKLRSGAKVTLLVLRKSSDPKCLQPDFSLPKPKQTQFFCWECQKKMFLKSTRQYSEFEEHILTCKGLQIEPDQKGEPSKSGQRS